MKIKNIHKVILTAAVALFATGCIEETYPTDSYVLSSQIASSETALAAMVNAIYTTMAVYTSDDGNVDGLGYDSMRLVLEHSTTAMLNAGANGYNTCAAWGYAGNNAEGSNRGCFPSYLYYGYIKVVNDVIRMIDPDDMTDTERHYLGIAYTFRALSYFELVQIMEYKYPTDTRFTFEAPENDLHNLGVPIVTETTTQEESTNNPRATVDEVYDLILSDLAKAEEYLSDFNRSDPIEPNLACIYGMYARIYTTIATRVETSVTYKDEATYWSKAWEYADLAISTSGCTPLTEDEWTDPLNGFNNRYSQNSWLWATTISELTTYSNGWLFRMLMCMESDFSVYGWRTGRSLDRKMYERLSDYDWRKRSWIAPNFFYESTNQVEGEPYLIEQDSEGNFVNNKWGGWNSREQSDYNDDYSGFGPEKYQYRLSTSPSYLRSRFNDSYGFTACPWLYINLKFRPANGLCTSFNAGSATDYPVMRVEEMYFLKAEIAMHTQGLAAACNLLEEIVQTRNPQYSFSASSEEEFIDEYCFQKAIEFWGEGVNYFDDKRLERGIHRAYLGNSWSSYSYALDIDQIHVGWTPGWNTVELTTNPAIYHYNNPYTDRTTIRVIQSNDEIIPYYGCDLDDPKPQSEWVKIVE